MTLAAMLREGGSPGKARAADKLETGRRVWRVPISETDANPYRILQTGMVAVGPQDYYKEVVAFKDDDLALADSTSAPDSGTYGDATVAEAATDAPVATGADAGDDEGGSGLQKFRRGLDALSPDRPRHAPVLPTVEVTTRTPQLPTQRSPTLNASRPSGHAGSCSLHPRSRSLVNTA